MDKTCKYIVNGFYYTILRIENEMVYLKVGRNEEFPVRIEDVVEIG